MNLKGQRLNRDDITELILEPGSDVDISVCNKSDSDVCDN